jgi:hypothetical protein
VASVQCVDAVRAQGRRSAHGAMEQVSKGRTSLLVTRMVASTCWPHTCFCPTEMEQMVAS